MDEYSSEFSNETNNIDNQKNKNKGNTTINNTNKKTKRKDSNKTITNNNNNNGNSNGINNNTTSSNSTSSSSSLHLPSHNTPWTEEENKLFEEGIKMYGKGNWKDISKIVGTRNSLQVKNHARQYLKKLAKSNIVLTPSSTSITPNTINSNKMITINNNSNINTTTTTITTTTIPIKGNVPILLPVSMKAPAPTTKKKVF